ncbi:MAG TPA: SIMPL domain-containing protein [Gaiellaceae bacterium]|jgi:hypothetical protein|nr:SIMPL domain-containing protein [Gaiellaceae bacterium]
MQGERLRWARELPELLLGLLAIAIAVAIAAIVAANAIRDVKRQRDTIVVTGSAKQPISANLATWRLSASAQARTSAEAVRTLRRDVAGVDAFLAGGDLGPDSVRKPPIQIEQIMFSVPTGLAKPRFRQVPAWRLTQRFEVQTGQIEKLERLASTVDELLLQGADVATANVRYLSTQLTEARFEALRKATADARRRAETLADGLGGHLGAVKSVDLGVFQITPRNSTDVSDYGINDTTSRLKDVTAVVRVTFRVER